MYRSLLTLTTVIFLHVACCGAVIARSGNTPYHDIATPVKTCGKTWVKNAWSVLEPSDSANTVLFGPASGLILGYNPVSGHSMAHLEQHRQLMPHNLWNIITYHFLKGDLDPYLPYDPNWFVNTDEGYLLFPLSPVRKDGTFFTDSVFRQQVMEGLIGNYYDARMVAVESISFPGEDSISAEGYVVYHPRPYKWYSDKDIVQYVIRETWILDETGSPVEKHIAAIAPVINAYDWDNNFIGTRKPFWVDFGQLKPLLANYYLPKNGNQEQLSFLAYFEQCRFNSRLLSEDQFHVQKR